MIKFKTIYAGIKNLKNFGWNYTYNMTKRCLLARRIDRLRDKIYKNCKPDGIVKKNILGYNFLLDMSDFGIHKDLFLDGIREPNATAFTMSVLSDDDVALEIGANIGYYALIESRICKSIYAIEPHPDNYNKLEEHIKINNISNVHPFCLAIGNCSGIAKLYTSEKSNWHSIISDHSHKSYLHVEMMTGDDFLSDKELVSFIRMDVEGYELQVLRGMPKTLASLSLKRIFLELHADVLSKNEVRELIDILKNNSFAPELIVQHDRPFLSKIFPLSHIENIYYGDQGTYEIFFVKMRDNTKKR